MIKLLIGGSPCSYWSIARSTGRETEATGTGWELFKNYLTAKEIFKPDLFLYENNKSAAQLIKDQISHELGVPLMHINSALVSAQLRQRFYAFNWTVPQPADRNIVMRNIAEHKTAWNNRQFPTRQGSLILPCWLGGFSHSQGMGIYSLDGKSVCVCSRGNTGYIAYPDDGSELYPVYQVKNEILEMRGRVCPVKLSDGRYIFRKATPLECERLQTLPDGYTAGISKTQRYKVLGNGWTAEVIIHILAGALRNVPAHEKIVVLSMYDGIATGRYCLDKLGFQNVTYYAFEIDKYAKQIALKNYPDIIEMGDAFKIKEAAALIL